MTNTTPNAEALAAAVNDLRAAAAGGRTDHLATAVERVRALDSDHPELHLAAALLFQISGRTHEALSARLRGYERLIALQDDPLAKERLNGHLDQLERMEQGYAVMKPIATASSNPAILKSFARVAQRGGQAAEAEDALRRLRDITGETLQDMEDARAVRLAIDAIITPTPDGLAVTCPAWLEPGRMHHSVILEPIIATCVERKLIDDRFPGFLVSCLHAFGIFSEASIRSCVLHLAAYKEDRQAEAFFDLVAHSLSRSQKIAILDDALRSVVRRNALAEFPRYAERLIAVSGHSLAPLVRLASFVGVDARKNPAWAETLDGLYRRASDDARSLRTPTSADAASPPTARQFLEARPVLRPDRPGDAKIDVFLKCVRRPFDIRPFVSFWMECFGTSSRYRIRLLDDSGLDLKTLYAQYPIHDSRSLREGRNLARELFSEGRRPLSMLGWESIANLAPFLDAESDWFWNIDADDIRPLIDQTVSPSAIREKLEAAEAFATRGDLLALSYDLWASAHYLLDHGYHWTFGICFCRKDLRLLDRMLASLGGIDLPIFKINLDHLLSRLSEGYLGQGIYKGKFASFAFDRTRLLQLDPQGNEIHHAIEGLGKRIAFHRMSGPGIQNHLHEKTLVL